MGLTRLCMKNPAAVAVVLAVIALLGGLSLTRLPIQLLPNIERPVGGIWTGWRAASPREVESEITEPIERELRGLSGLKSMQSWSNAGGAWISLEFNLGTDMSEARTSITSRLQRVRGLPADADRPQMDGVGGGDAGETLIYLFLQRLPGFPEADQRLYDFAETRIRPEIESVEGVAGVSIESDQGKEIVRVTFDPFLAAQLGVTLDQIVQNVNRSSDVTGGSVEVGRRNYTMRFEGRFTSDELKDTILSWRDGAPVRLSDIAEISVGPDRRGGVVVQNGNPAIGMRVLREPGTNTLAALDAITAKQKELNSGVLAEMGYTIQKSFDPSLFIKNALRLLTGNLFLGMILTVAILWVMLRRTTPTLLIAATIPVCLAATVVVLHLMGRSINVISLAGLAFATGMALDAAIVVIEDILSLKEKHGDAEHVPATAISRVMGALFASTVTTIAVFVPIIFFEDVEGQLFTDLALTICVAVALSFFVAITILPTGAAKYLRSEGAKAKKADFIDRVPDLAMRLTSTPQRRLAWIAGLTIIPVVAGWLMFPSMNYLPRVKRAAIDGFISFPSGASVDMIRTEFADVVVKRLDPYMKGEKEPALLNYYLFTAEWGGNIGVRPKIQSNMKKLEKLVNDEILIGFPDTRVFAQEGDLFGDFGGGGQIAIELQAADYDALSDAIPAASDIIMKAVPGATVWPNPDPQIVTPEISIYPNDRRLAEVGLNRAGLSSAVRALGDGLWLGEFFHEDGRIDIYLEATNVTSPESLSSIPLATPSGAVVPLGELATISRSVGPQQIRRLDARRTFSLGINAPEGVPLGDIIRMLDENAKKELYSILPQGSSLKYAGEADALKRAIANLSGNFLLAIALLFLIMTALFKSAKDAALVVISLPMAAVGGIAAIRLLNLVNPTPLDLLGMMGFILMLGIVVNNAILLVAQTRQSEAEGMTNPEAVREALRLRTRPIFMTMATTLAGTMPLVLAPGEGAQIYRGLAAVSVGGAVVSAVFTLVLLPALLQLRPLAAPVRVTQALQPAE